MRPLSLLALAVALYCPAAFAVDREFNDIVRAISDEFHSSPLHIPFLGLVNMVSFVARPAGASHIRVAVFENLKAREQDAPNLSVMIRTAVGPHWTPFVQVHSRRRNREETVLVFMRMKGRDCRLLITTIEPRDATVVELKLNPEGVARWISSPHESARSGHSSAEF